MNRTATLATLMVLALVLPVGAAAQGDFQKGVSYYNQGKYAEAVIEFEAIIKEQPEYETGHRVLGNCYLKLKQYRKAAASFARATELKGDKFVTHYGQAVANFNLGQYREVAATLLRAEKLASTPQTSYQLFSLRGSAYYRLNDFQRAAADLEKAVAVQRGQFGDVLQLGISYARLGREAEAERFLTQALALDSNSTEARNFLSDIHYKQGIAAIEAGQYTVAIQRLESLVQNNPSDGDAFFNLGLAYLFTKDLPAAQAAFVKSGALNDARWETFDRLGYIYEMQGDYQKSLDSYTRALSLNDTAALRESVGRLKERIKRASGS